MFPSLGVVDVDRVGSIWVLGLGNWGYIMMLEGVKFILHSVHLLSWLQVLTDSNTPISAVLRWRTF